MVSPDFEGTKGPHYYLMDMKMLAPYSTFSDTTLLITLRHLTRAWHGCKSRLLTQALMTWVE